MKNSILSKSIGNNIREARKKKNWNCAGLGKTIGVSKGCVSDWENGKVDINVSRLQQIAVSLGTDISCLFSSERNSSTEELHNIISLENIVIKNTETINELSSQIKNLNNKSNKITSLQKAITTNTKTINNLVAQIKKC